MNPAMTSQPAAPIQVSAWPAGWARRFLPIVSRRAFAVFAAFGICGYLGHLAYDVFEDSLMFPFVLTLLGFAIIGAGLWWQRHEAQLTQWLRALLPQALRELIEHRAS